MCRLSLGGPPENETIRLITTGSASKALCEPGKASTSGLATYVLQGSETSRHNAKRRCLDKGDGTFDSHLGTDACSNAAPHHAHPPGASAAAAASRSADGQCDVSGAELGSEAHSAGKHRRPPHTRAGLRRHCLSAVPGRPDVAPFPARRCSHPGRDRCNRAVRPACATPD